MSEVTFTTHSHDQGCKHKAEFFKQTTTFPSNKPCFSNNLQWSTSIQYVKLPILMTESKFSSLFMQ